MPPADESPGDPWRRVVLAGDVDEVRRLLADGVDPHAAGRFGSPLVLAAGRGHAAIVRMLLDAGARADGGHALINACAHHGDPEIVAALLDAGIRPAPPRDAEAWSVRVTALYYRQHASLAQLAARLPAETLVDAAIDGDVQRVQALLDAGADLGQRLQHGLDALTCAAAAGHGEVVALLVERGADIEHDCVLGRPVLAALRRGHLGVAQRLVASGAKAEGLCHALVRVRGSEEAWSWALQTEAPKELDRLLALAAQCRNTLAAKALLGAGASPDGCDAFGFPALMRAAWANAAEIVQMLLDAGADPNIPDRHGRPMMHTVLVYDDVTTDFDEPDYDPALYDHNAPILRSKAVRLLLAAGARLPWES